MDGYYPHSHYKNRPVLMKGVSGLSARLIYMEFEIVMNPASASGKAHLTWEEIKPVLASNGCKYTLHTSTPTESITEICRKLTSQGRKVNIIVIGGDGTSNEAVNGIADIKNTNIGFVQCGTGNDLQRDMNVPVSRRELVSRMLDGKVKRTSDIGELTVLDGEKPFSRRFNISCDIGVGAATCAYVNKSRIKPLLNFLGAGQLIYPIEALKVCFTLKPSKILVACNGRKRLYKKCLCVVGMNHKNEGGGCQFCPDADFDDGKLDFCIGNAISRLGFLRVLLNISKGTHINFKGIYGERTDKITIKSETPMWIHTDGEVIGKVKNVKMRILPEKLNLLF